MIAKAKGVFEKVEKFLDLAIDTIAQWEDKVIYRNIPAIKSIIHRISRRVVIAVVAVLFVGAGLFVWGIIESDSEKFQKGMDAIKQKKFREAFRIWLPLADKGHANAQFWLAAFSHQNVKSKTSILPGEYVGDFIKKKEKQYAHLPLSSREQTELFGLKMNVESALKWYRAAATQGHIEAQIAMGNLYKNGDLVVQDYDLALEWYRRAAAQGDAKAGERHDALAELIKNNIRFIGTQGGWTISSQNLPDGIVYLAEISAKEADYLSEAEKNRAFLSISCFANPENPHSVMWMSSAQMMIPIQRTPKNWAYVSVGRMAKGRVQTETEVWQVSKSGSDIFLRKDGRGRYFVQSLIGLDYVIISVPAQGGGDPTAGWDLHVLSNVLRTFPDACQRSIR